MTSTVLPPKKRAKANLSLSFQAAAVVGGTSPGGDFDDNDDGPVWYAEFDLAPRIDQVPRHVEAPKALRVSGARNRSKHNLKVRLSFHV